MDALITNQAFLTSPGMVPQFFLRPEASLLRVYLVESQRTCVALPILTTHFSIFAVFTCLLRPIRPANEIYHAKPC
jgi:hypothetical protein